MRVGPCIATTGPIQGQKQESRRDDKQRRSNGIASPDILLESHPGVVRPFLRPVKGQEPNRSYPMTSSLDPEDVAPSAGADVCDSTCSKAAYTIPIILAMMRNHNRILHTHSPPTAPPMNANPFARGRCFMGRISEGIACTMEIVASVTPIRIPPPMSIFIDVALAQIMEPTTATSGGIEAIYFRSRTSDRRPTSGDSTLCISRGPYTE